jgi:hypothetical protein
MRRWFSLSVAAITILFVSAVSKTAATPVCALPPISPKRDLPNMFTAAQEGDLGGVLALGVENNAYELDSNWRLTSND